MSHAVGAVDARVEMLARQNNGIANGVGKGFSNDSFTKVKESIVYEF